MVSKSEVFGVPAGYQMGRVPSLTSRDRFQTKQDISIFSIFVSAMFKVLKKQMYFMFDLGSDP